jgi:hypothetical protein
MEILELFPNKTFNKMTDITTEGPHWSDTHTHEAGEVAGPVVFQVQVEGPEERGLEQ